MIEAITKIINDLGKNNEQKHKKEINNNSAGINTKSLLKNIAQVFRGYSGLSYMEIGVHDGRTLLPVAKSNPDFYCVGVDNFTKSNKNYLYILSQTNSLDVNNITLINLNYISFDSISDYLKNKRLAFCFIRRQNDYNMQLRSLELIYKYSYINSVIVTEEANCDIVRNANAAFLSSHNDCKLIFQSIKDGNQDEESGKEVEHLISGLENDITIIVKDNKFPKDNEIKNNQQNERKTKDHQNDFIKNLNDVSQIRFNYKNAPLYDIQFKDTACLIDSSSENLFNFIEKKSLDELLQNISLKFTWNNKTVDIVPKAESPTRIDAMLIKSILKECRSDLYNFYERYMVSNYPRIKKDVEIVKGYLKDSSKVLDVGSLPPLFSALLKKQSNVDITVIDPNAKEFERFFNKEKIDYHNKDIFEVDSKGNKQKEHKYDMVCFCEVIEHLTGDLLKSLQTITKFVKNEGYLFVTTTNLKSFSGILGLISYESGLASKYNETVKKQYDRVKETGYPGHVREYTEKEIIDLFKGFGFKHVGSFFQSDYRENSRLDYKLSYLLESMFPKYKLFGKYLFKKHF